MAAVNARPAVGDCRGLNSAAPELGFFPAVEHPQPAIAPPGNQAVVIVGARPLLKRRMHGFEGIEFTALQPYIATLEADRVADCLGEDDGAIGRPQLGAAIGDPVPDVFLAMGPAE